MCIVLFCTVDRARRGLRVVELADTRLAISVHKLKASAVVVVEMRMAARRVDSQCPAALLRLSTGPEINANVAVDV